MKRYAVCNVIGNGTEDSPYRPACRDYSVSNSVAIAPSADLINGNKLWVLAVIAAPQEKFTQMAADNRIVILPFGPENFNDYWINFGTSQERNQFSTRIKSRTGLTVNRDDNRTIYEILVYLGTNLDSNFKPENMDISDDHAGH